MEELRGGWGMGVGNEGRGWGGGVGNEGEGVGGGVLNSVTQ